MATLNFPDAPDTGDIYSDSNSGFTYEWNGTVWISKDPSTASNIREIDDISSGFDGSDTTFTLQVAGVNVEPANVQQLIISVGGVMQNAGDDYTVSGSTLTFTTAPTSGLTFFGTLLGTALSLNTVADGSVGTSSFEQPLTIGTANDSLTIPGNAVVSGILTAANAYVSGILTAKTLNYDNVTDIYSTGIITAKGGIQQTGNEGLHVSAGITTVGILTATKIAIVKSDGALLEVTTNTGAADATLRLSEGATGSTTNGGGMFYSGADNKLHVTCGTDSTTKRVTVDRDTGNVGINSLAPQQSLEVGGNAVIGIDQVTDNPGTSVGITTVRGHHVNSDSTYAALYLSNSKSAGGGTAPTASIRAARETGNFGTNLSFYTNASTGSAGDGSERARIDDIGRILLGNSTSTATQGSEFFLQQSGTDFATSGFAPIRYSNNTSGPTFGFAHSRNASLNVQTILQDGDEFGKIRFYGSDGVDFANYGAQIRARVDGTPGADDMPGRIEFATTGDGETASTERLRITSTGGFSFDNGQLVERVKIVSGKLSDNTSIDLINGMVYYFTTTETTTLAPNIRIDGSNTLNDAMDTGDVISVTLVTTAAAAGYINQVNIDGSSQTVEWAGAEAPSAGGDGGLDVNAFTIIKTAANTYKVLGNYTNFD